MVRSETIKEIPVIDKRDKGAVMLTAKVTSRGQITIPKEIREKLGISPGEEIEFVERGGVFFIKKPVKKSPFEKWMGRLKGPKGSQSEKIIDDLRGK